MWDLGGCAGEVCRVCLESGASRGLTPLTANVTACSAPSIGEALARITKRELEEGNLPKNVCSPCIERISVAYELILQYERSEIMFKKTMSRMYQQFETILSDDLEHDNDTILIVLPESDIKSEADGNVIDLQDDERETDDENAKNLFVFTLQNIKKEPEVPIVINSKDSDTERNSKTDSSLETVNTVIVKNENLPQSFESNDDDSKNINCDSTTEVLIEYSTEAFSDASAVFECTQCKNIFLKDEELKSHICNIVKEDASLEYSCTICYRTFDRSSSLRQHYLIHDNEENMETESPNITTEVNYCSLCDTQFESKTSLNEHMKSDHSVDNWTDNSMSEFISSPKVENDSHICTMCNEQFENMDELRQHKKTHPEGTRHVCSVCDKSYLEASTLRRHMIIHTGKKTYLCPVCGKSFFYRNVLKSHMIYHSEKKHKCVHCDKRFHVRHILREHIRMSHTDNKFNYMCEVCGKLCSSRRRFNIHKESHTSMCCPTCGKNYRNMRYYKQHLQMHNGVTIPKKVFECDYCGEKRPLKTLLELHILSKHLQERRYSCKLCGKAFFSKGSLSEHEFLHTGVKSEKCNLCGRVLANKKALILHNRLHTGERPYPCYLCDERFLSSSRRRAHIKSKHGERTEQCTMCSSKFFLRSELNKHMLVHSKDPKKGKRAFVMAV